MKEKTSVKHRAVKLLLATSYAVSFLLLFLPGVVQVFGLTALHYVLIAFTVFVMFRTVIKHEKGSYIYFFFYAGLLAWMLCATIWLDDRMHFLP